MITLITVSAVGGAIVAAIFAVILFLKVKQFMYVRNVNKRKRQANIYVKQHFVESVPVSFDYLRARRCTTLNLNSLYSISF